MFIIITPFTLPVFLLIWGLDLWLLLASLRLILSYLPGRKVRQVLDRIKPITDPFPRTINRWMQQRSNRPISPWTPWLITIGMALMIRYLLFCITLGLHNPK